MILSLDSTVVRTARGYHFPPLEGSLWEVFPTGEPKKFTDVEPGVYRVNRGRYENEVRLAPVSGGGEGQAVMNYDRWKDLREKGILKIHGV